MSRAYGSSAKLLGIFEESYGVSPGGNFIQFPFISTSLGSEQPLLADDTIGNGRDPRAPSQDVITVSGDVVVPCDARFMGHWLKGLLGAPTTTAIAATGTITFSGQPANNSTITLKGKTWTFVTSGASGNQTNIGATLADTLTALVSDLNGSADTDIDDATYSANSTTLTVTHDTAGPTGNAFTLAAGTSPASNGTVSGATLSGGCYSHVYESAADSLPSMALEVGLSQVPNFAMNLGCLINTAAFDFQPSGQARVTFGVIAQGEDSDTTSGGGTPTTLTYTRFSQFEASIKKDGATLANITGATLNFSNNGDPVRVIRDDGKIEAVDPGICGATGNITARFADTTLLTAASGGTAVDLQFAYVKSSILSLTFDLNEVYLPKPKITINGPGGVEAPFAYQAAGESGAMITATLKNDVASYA